MCCRTNEKIKSGGRVYTEERRGTDVKENGHKWKGKEVDRREKWVN